MTEETSILDDKLLIAVILGICAVLMTWLLQGLGLIAMGKARPSRAGIRRVESFGDEISLGLLRERVFRSLSNFGTGSLSATDWKPFKLVAKEMASHNTVLLRFEVPNGKSLDLPVGRHLSVRAKITGNFVQRPYTPTSKPNQEGWFELLVKVYDLGKMSNYMMKMPLGATIDVRGPVGRFKYAPNMYKEIAMVCGGSGITPCLQVMRAVLESGDKEDQTKFYLLYQNRTEEDVLLRGDIDKLAKLYPYRVTVHYHLSNPRDGGWGKSNKGKSQISEKCGYITLDALKEIGPNRCDLVALCGPSGFNKSMRDMLFEIGHTKESLYTW